MYVRVCICRVLLLLCWEIIMSDWQRRRGFASFSVWFEISQIKTKYQSNMSCSTQIQTYITYYLCVSGIEGIGDRENRNNSQINITANSDTITTQYRMGYNNKYGFYTCAWFYICLTNKTWTHSSQITHCMHWSRAAISVSVYKISTCKTLTV